MRPQFLIAAPMALLAACGSSVDPETVLETVRLTEQAQIEALVAKDLAGVVRVYDADAVRVAPGSAPATGSAAIRAAFEPLVADPGLSVRVTPGPGWASTGGDLAVTTSSVLITTTDAASGGPVTATVANQTVWHKAEGASWTIASDYNVALPATEPTSAPASAE